MECLQWLELEVLQQFILVHSQLQKINKIMIYKQIVFQALRHQDVNDNGDAVPYAGKVTDKRIIIDKVYYRSPIAMWRFYGYYGGVGVVGNYQTYGQYADDTTFEIVPTWQNKLASYYV
jgi:hypothetical protein